MSLLRKGREQMVLVVYVNVSLFNSTIVGNVHVDW